MEIRLLFNFSQAPFHDSTEIILFVLTLQVRLQKKRVLKVKTFVSPKPKKWWMVRCVDGGGVGEAGKVKTHKSKPLSFSTR